MKKNHIIALGVFIVFALVVLTFVRPPESVTNNSGTQPVLLGTFEGTTACADCPGIVQRLTLMQDGPYRVEGTYTLSMTYLERDVEPFVENGRWTTERGTPMDPDATVYALYQEGNDTAQLFLRVDADTIRMLDQDGNEIDSPFPYDLTLMPEGAAATVLPEEKTLTGAMTCLPHRDTTGPQTLECAIGFKADDGVYYALDLVSLKEEERLAISSATRVTFTGVVTPNELLSTDQWQKYDTVGVMSVTQFRLL